MARPKDSKHKATLQREAARNTAATKARIFGTDLPDVKISEGGGAQHRGHEGSDIRHRSAGREDFA
jgi:hypothetical protein